MSMKNLYRRLSPWLCVGIANCLIALAAIVILAINVVVDYKQLDGQSKILGKMIIETWAILLWSMSIYNKSKK